MVLTICLCIYSNRELMNIKRAAFKRDTFFLAVSNKGHIAFYYGSQQDKEPLRRPIFISRYIPCVCVCVCVCVSAGGVHLDMRERQSSRSEEHTSALQSHLY